MSDDAPKDPEEELIQYESKDLEMELERKIAQLRKAQDACWKDQITHFSGIIADLEARIRDTPRLEQVRTRYTVQREAIKAYNLGMNLIANARQTEAIAHLLRFLELLKDEACYLYVPLKAEVHHKLALAFGFNVDASIDNIAVADVERAISEARLAKESCEGYANEKLLNLADLNVTLGKVLKETQRDRLRESIFGKELSPEALDAYKQGTALLHKGNDKEGRTKLAFFLQQQIPYDEKWRDVEAHEALAFSYWRTNEPDAALAEIQFAKEYYETTTGYGGKKLTDESSYKSLCQLEEQIKRIHKKDL